jgi:hypothetical protein
LSGSDSMKGDWDAEASEAGEEDEKGHRAGMVLGRWDAATGGREDDRGSEGGLALGRADSEDPFRCQRPTSKADEEGARRAYWSGGDDQEAGSFRRFQCRVRQCLVLWRSPRQWIHVGNEMGSAWVVWVARRRDHGFRGSSRRVGWLDR